MLDFEQMAGRGGRDGHTKCLVLLLAESWLYEDKKEAKNSNGTFRTKALRTDEEMFDYVQCEACRRAHLASLNNDLAVEGEHILLSLQRLTLVSP